MHRNLYRTVRRHLHILFLLITLSFSYALKANSELQNTVHSDSAATHEELSVTDRVVEHIMNHVADANVNHLGTIKEEGKEDHHLTIELPCILYRKATENQAGKWSFFMSSKFHHGHEAYEGYKLDEHTGRVVDANTGTRDTFYDLSITKNVFNMLLGFIILSIIFFTIKSAYVKRQGQAPKGIQAFFEPIIVFLIDDIAKPNLGDKYEKYLPYLLCVFFFILINNLLGLVPFLGSINSSGNISFTMVLATCSLLLINISGNKHYWQHIFAMPGVPKWALAILTPVEIMGVILKPAVLMLRLFGNITGGHITVLAVVGLIFIMGEYATKMSGATAGTLISFPILLFVNAIELFVAFLQAYIFTLLTGIFIGAAIEEHLH